ncbi:MAG: GNAT family N-acetyltransferase, partial [Candidatus Coatesbacteria bacterium]|nr:GNAT family N-acetyltransferase [Candidatus Coatesbacteria bacterium]
MREPVFRVVRLSSDHYKGTRDRFDSGSKALDDYLKHQVTQDIRRKVTSCYVALAENEIIAGYYTLASASVDLSELPDELKRKLPRYPSVPAARMGRLAVDLFFQKKG